MVEVVPTQAGTAGVRVCVTVHKGIDRSETARKYENFRQAAMFGLSSGEGPHPDDRD